MSVQYSLLSQVHIRRLSDRVVYYLSFLFCVSNLASVCNYLMENASAMYCCSVLIKKRQLSITKAYEMQLSRYIIFFKFIDSNLERRNAWNSFLCANYSDRWLGVFLVFFDLTWFSSYHVLITIADCRYIQSM
jgi:hypothetical protein